MCKPIGASAISPQQSPVAEHWLNALLQGAADGVVTVDPQGRIINLNPAAERLFNCTPPAVVGRPLTVLLDPPGEQDRLLACIRQGEPLAARETSCRLADGQQRTFQVSLAPARDREGRVLGAAVLVRDWSQTRQLEEQFRQAQKMEVIGRLAGGIAHDFNNLLTVINGYSTVLLATLPEHGKPWEMVHEISRAGERAAALTRQLLVYCRKQVVQPTILDLRELIGNVQRMLQRLIGEDVELVIVPGSGPCLVKADAAQLEQVLMNLAVNARDAMPKGGKLTIAADPLYLNSGYTAKYAEVRPVPYIQLSVSDTGVGMDPATRARIFEPFFTTKEPGKGTGLGLATVYSIVKQSGGHIEVFSEMGKGTRFTIYLPQVPGQDHAPQPAAVRPELPDGRETLLLVEDEDGVRSLARYILQRAGYTVLEAANGEEALRVAAHSPWPIDLLVTDVVMPRMGGCDLAGMLQPKHPGMRVLFMSGYTDDAIVRQGILAQDMPFLHKPFTMNALAHKIREVLDARVPG
jgi:two-component system cell cycle sensor histidine kinase/response regulator CckA